MSKIYQKLLILKFLISKQSHRHKKSLGILDFTRLWGIMSLFKLPTKQLISTVMVDICFQKQASFRLFPLIIFSFQFFRYHLGITNGYQWTHLHYASVEGNAQVIFIICHTHSIIAYLQTWFFTLPIMIFVLVLDSNTVHYFLLHMPSLF